MNGKKSNSNVLYNYKPYPHKRKAVFSVLREPNEYTLGIGWICDEQEITIIGETDHEYITRLIESSCGHWVGDTVETKEYILPIGIHKSRFVKWLDGQLSLFN